MADLDAIAQRPAEYLAETGVHQLGGGLIFFFLGSSILTQRLLPRTPLYMLAVPLLCDSVCTHLPFCRPATEKRFTDIFRSLSGLLGSAALVVAGKHL